VCGEKEKTPGKEFSKVEKRISETKPKDRYAILLGGHRKKKG